MAQLTVEEARTIVEPLYKNMGHLTKESIEAVLEQCTTPDFETCGNEGECTGRAAVTERWTALGKAVSDISWTIRDMWVCGDEVIVRGEGRGTPVDTFQGQAPTGRSFRTMSIDIHTIRDGRIAHTWHVENWKAALRQLRGQ